MRFETKVERLRIEKYGGREAESFLEDVVKMAQGESFEYVLGEVDFCGAKIDLALRPMIPRPETEHWVKQLLTFSFQPVAVREAPSVLRSLDLFSGSGNVGLALLKNIPDCTVDMIEFDPKLKQQIEISIEKNKIAGERVKVMTGDTWEGASGHYDIITAVPPYVPSQMKEEVMKELRSEDPLSFFDKEDGYYYHTQVLSRAKEFLAKDGVLYLEFDITQREKIEQLAVSHGFSSYSFLKDPYGHEFVLIIKD